jgi:hypothetical protein
VFGSEVLTVGVPGVGAGAGSKASLRIFATEYRNCWTGFAGRGSAEFIPPNESKSPTKAFPIGAKGDGDQFGVEAATAAEAFGVWIAVTWPTEATGPDAMTGLLHEQVTSELACPGGWAGRMSLCPGRTPESAVTMSCGSPVTARTG